MKPLAAAVLALAMGMGLAACGHEKPAAISSPLSGNTTYPECSKGRDLPRA